MRVLHLTPELPCWPGGTGGATRQFHLLRRLVELGHEVTVVAPVPAGETHRQAELEAAGIRLRGAVRPPGRIGETIGAIARQPSLVTRAATLPVLAWQVSVFWTALRPLALDEIASARPDVITVEHDNAAHWIGDLAGEIPAALVLQNVGRHYYESRARAVRGVRAGWFSFEARRFSRHDGRWLPHYGSLVAVSARDAEDLRATVGGHVEVVPNGVASDELTPVAPSSEPATLLFTGTLSHPPNAEGIGWFADAVWPRLRDERPDVKLLVVGRDAPQSVLDLDRRAGIEVVGAVPTMAPYFERATAVVVPLLSGGGTRLKILEAFACERALVSTSTGCEGLAVEDGRELLVADDPERFASATLRLLDDAPLREALAGAGRELAERRYDWRVLGDELERALTALAHGGNGHG
jgi:glycosyltransferase involved in cell wall biosynthesis